MESEAGTGREAKQAAKWGMKQATEREGESSFLEEQAFT